MADKFCLLPSFLLYRNAWQSCIIIQGPVDEQISYSRHKYQTQDTCSFLGLARTTYTLFFIHTPTAGPAALFSRKWPMATLPNQRSPQGEIKALRQTSHAAVQVRDEASKLELRVWGPQAPERQRPFGGLWMFRNAFSSLS